MEKWKQTLKRMGGMVYIPKDFSDFTDLFETNMLKPTWLKEVFSI